jgi:hypothetical protein
MQSPGTVIVVRRRWSLRGGQDPAHSGCVLWPQVKALNGRKGRLWQRFIRNVIWILHLQLSPDGTIEFDVRISESIHRVTIAEMFGIGIFAFLRLHSQSVGMT